MGSNNQFINVNEDDKNEIKLMLLRRKMTDCVRRKLHEKLPEEGLQLYKALDRQRDHFKRLMKKGYLPKEQFNILFPHNSFTKSSMFDAPLTIKVLFTKNLCGYRHPGTGWKPSLTDHSDVANFVRIELARHMMQHLGETVDQAMLDEIFDLVQPALLDFNISQKEIDKIRYLEVGKTIGSKYLHKDFTYNLTIPVANFIGREEKIKEIHKRLEMIHQTKQKYAVVLHGLPGVGKSETIRKYCNDYGSGKYYLSIVWINAESKESIENCFNDVAAKLQIPMVGESGKKTALNLVIDSIYSVLAVEKADKSNRRVLFVFDNINDMEFIREFLPSPQQTSPPFIIATTQSEEWDHQRFEMIPLYVFTEDMSDKFLQNELDTPEFKVDRLKLLSSLQYHPLALQQAVSYINLNEMSIHMYLSIFESNDWFIFHGEETQNQLEKKSLIKTFSMALNRLEIKDREAIELLNKLAYLDGKQIKEALVMGICNNDIIETHRRLNILQNYSLINRRKGTQEDNNKIVTVHSLIQQTIKCHIEEKGDTNTYIHILFQLVKNDFSDTKVMKNRGKLMFTHFLHLFNRKNIKAYFIEQCLKDDYYNYLYPVFKMYHQEQSFIKLCSKLIEQIRERNIETMQLPYIKNLIALCYINLGQSEIAMEHLKEIQQTLPNYSDNSTEFSLTVQHNIGSCLQGIGKNKEALQLYKELERKQAIFPKNDPDRLTTENNIASCLRNMGKYEKALTLYKEVEKKRSQILEETDPDLLITQNNIALCLQNIGNLEEALNLYKEVERKESHTLGETHPSLLTTRNNIAGCLQGMGKYEKALKLYKEIVRKRSQILGERHPDVLTTQNNIALCLQRMENYEEALALYKEVERKGLQILGEKHPDVLITQNNIASCLQDMGYYEEAMTLYKKVERKRSQILEETDPSLLSTQSDVAGCLQAMSKYEEAVELYNKIEKKQSLTLKEKHPDILITQNNIALCLQAMEKNEEAVELYKEVERKQLQILGETHPSVVITQNNIALCLQNMGKYKEALQLYKDIEKKLSQIMGEAHPSVITTLNNIASCLQDIGKFMEALEFYKKAEKKQSQLLGENHPNVLVIQNSIASCFQDMGKYKKALELYKEVERKRSQIFGANHASVLNTKNNIACCLGYMGKCNEALNILIDVEEIQLQMFGPEDSVLLITQFNKACQLQLMDRHKEAIDILNSVKTQQTKLFGDHHPDVIRTQTTIAEFNSVSL